MPSQPKDKATVRPKEQGQDVSEASSKILMSKNVTIWRLVKRIVASLVILLALISIYVWVSIGQAGGLVSWLEQKLSVPEWGLRTQIEKANISLFDDGLSASLNLHDVKIIVAEQQVTLPHLSLATSWALWIQAQSWQAELSQLNVDLVQEDTGFKPSGDWAPLATLFADSSSMKEDSAVSSDGFYELLADRQLKLTKSRIQVQKVGSDSVIGLEDVTMNVAMDETARLQLEGQGHIINSDESFVAFQAFRDMRSGLADVQLNIESLPALQLLDYVPDNMNMIAGFGMVDVTAHLTLDQTQLQTASIDITAREGRLAENLSFESLSSSLRYSHIDDYLVIPSLKLKMADGQDIQFSGEAAGLSLPKTGLSGDVNLQDVPIDSLLSQWPQTALPDVRAYMIKSLSGGDFAALNVSFKGQYDKSLQAMTVSNLVLNGDVAQVRVDTGFGQYEQFVGTANGSLAFEVASGGVLKQAAVELNVSDGYVRTTVMPSALRFDNASASMRYRPGLFEARDVFVLFTTDGQFTADIDVGFNEARRLDDIKLTLQAPRLSGEVFRHLFPETLAPAVTDIIRTKIPEGWVQNASLLLAAQQDLKKTGADNPPLTITKLELDASLSDMAFVYVEGQKPLRDITGLLTLRDNEMTIFLDKGVSEAFSLLSANIRLAPLVSSGRQTQQLDITADTTSSVQDLLPLLQSPEIDILSSLPVNLNEAAGQVRARMSLRSDIKKGSDVDLELVSVDATIQGGDIPAFISDYDLSDADVVLGYDESGVVISGTAKLADVRTDFTLKQKGTSFEVSGKIPPQYELASHIKMISGQDVAGAVGGQFVLSSEDNAKTITAHLSADFTQASLYSPVIKWAKLREEPGKISASFDLVDGQIRQIDQLKVDFKDLMGTGHIAFTDTGEIDAIYLQDLYWPGNDIDDVIFERTGDDHYHLIAEGPQIDLRPLRENSSGESTLALSFDVTSPQLEIDDGIFLVGQMTGRLSEEGAGEATLQGALQRDEDVLLSQGTITAYFGEGGEYLSAVGLIGGAESRLEFSPDEDGGALLIITTNNAGRVLSGLGITDAVRSGRMVLTNHYPKDDFTNFTTTINLEEFNVIEAPTAVRAFSVLGLAGLYSLVEGDGTRFTTGEVVIETTGTKHNLKKLNASGGALGVTMVGTYDRATRQVDMSGNLVPVNQFSKIIGALPLFGDLLSGTDNAGIFATQFNVSGPIDDPQTSVNAASLVPGILRDLFSPEWLKNEASRLFGADDNQTE